MELHAAKKGKYLEVETSGRLDAAWSDFFTDTLLGYIRNGEHHLVVEATALEFLSSAGIRSLVRVNKELAVVRGSFQVVYANDFVAGTLTTTGFGNWLSDKLPWDAVSFIEASSLSDRTSAEVYTLSKEGSLGLSTIDGWRDWSVIDESLIRQVKFHEAVFALGIGSTSTDLVKARNQYGEMMAVCGNVVCQVPEEQGRPDYLLAVNEFVPEMKLLRALICRGEMSHMFRFAPSEGKPEVTVSALAGQVLDLTAAPMAAFVVIAEIAGLVGANLIKSPGEIGTQQVLDLFDVRDWLSFSGERIFLGEQAMLFGVVARSAALTNNQLLKPLPSNPELAGHFHAAVFPFQPIPNGKIELQVQADKLFAGSPPLALVHLIDDDRPVQGLGQSSFVRGACWCAPVKNTEDIL